MTDRHFLNEQIGLDYLLGRLDAEAAEAFEAELLESAQLQEDVLLSAMLMSSVRQYAAVVSVDSFRALSDS